MNAKMTPLAVLTAQLTPTPDGWQQLLPKGEFRSRDGSPTDVAHWFLDEAIASRLIGLVRNLKQDVLVDYEHESWFKAKQGKEAGAVLAAGGGLAASASWRALAAGENRRSSRWSHPCSRSWDNG